MGKIKDEELRLNIIVNGNKGQKAILELDDANRKLKNTNDDLRKAKQLLIAEDKKNTTEYKKLTTQIKANNTVLKINKDKIAATKKQLGLSALSSKQLTQEQRKLKSQLASTVKSLQPEAYAKYEKQLEEVNAELGKLSKNGKATGGIIGNMKSQFGGVSGLLAGAFSVGAAIQFGKKVADNVKLLRETKSTLQQIAGLKGLELTNATVGIKALSDTYDKETKQMTIAVHNFAEGMEIDFDSALELTKQGFLDGADANEEFLDKLREYPVLLKEAGFSADEAVALMTQEVKTGIYSDKGVDAIKEANLRLREMTNSTAEALDAIGISSETVQTELTNGSKTTFDIMQQVSKKLSELPPQSAEVGTAIADVFGGPGEDAGLKYLANLQNIDLTTGNLTDTTNDYLEAKKKELQANEAMNLVWIKLTGTGSSLSTLYSNLRLGIAELLGGQQSLTKTFEDQASNVISLNNKLIPLADEYDNLKSKTELSKDEQDRLKTVIGQIAQITPTAITAFDEYGNALDISSDKARDFIETQKALLSFNNKEAIEENTDALVDYQRKIKQIQASLNQRDEDGDLFKLKTFFDAETKRTTEFRIKLTAKEIQIKQAKLAELQKLEAGALESIDQLSGDYLDKYKQREEEKTIVTKEEIKKRIPKGVISPEQKAKNKAFAKAEEELTKIIAKQKSQRLINQKVGLDKELALIDEKYRTQLEKAIGHEALKTELEDLRDQEKADLKVQREAETALRIKELEDTNYVEKEAQRLEREALAAITDEEKTLLLLARTQWIANEQLRIEEEKELARLKINGATESEIAAIKAKFALKKTQVEDTFTKSKAASDKAAVKDEATLNRQRTQEYANMFGGIAQLLGKHTAAGKAASIAQATMNTYQGITQVWAAKSVLPEPFATAAKIVSTATVLASGLGAVKQITSTKTPGYETGLYPIQRTDGKIFDSKLSNSSHTQLVTQPTYFSDADYLAGEGGPEIIIDTPTLKNLDPSVIQKIYATAARTRGFEDGYYSSNETSSSSEDSPSGLDLSYLTSVLIRIDQKLDMPLQAPPVLIGDAEIQRQKNREDKLDQTRENAKIK